MSGLEAFLGELRRAQEADAATALEPDVDARELGNIGDGAQLKEDEDLERGAVLKAVIEPGEGEPTQAATGDLVFLHYSIVSIPGGEVLHSTRVESGGPGQPQPFVVGGGAARPLRGVEIALLGMRPLERCMLELKPEYAYAHKDCTEVPPRGQRRDARVGVDVQLARWCPGGGAVRAVDAAPGVIRRTLAPGQGWETPRAPFEVTLHVEARALASDGADAGGPAFFSTAAAPGGGGGEPLVVSLGSGALPPGLDAAVCGMLRGETATVWCPAGAVRGGAAVPPPPDAALRFVQYQVRLLDFLQVRDLLGDGAATKRTLTKGRGEFPADCPLEDAAVRMHLRVRAAGAAAWVWDSRTAAEGAPAEAGLAQSSRGPEPGGDAAGEGAGAALVVETGTGALPECLDAAVRLMLRGEVSSVRSEWSRAYAGREDAPAGLPPGGAVEFELELVDFEAEANLAEADAAAKLARAATWREQGNAVFRAGRWRLAKQKYLKGLRCVGQALDIETEEQAAAAAALKAACLVNLAACAHKEEAYGEAISWCTKAIKEDGRHAKAHFRRAQAQCHLGEYEAARADFEAAARLDPGAAGEVERELKRMAARARAAEDKQRREMGSFFNKAAAK